MKATAYANINMALVKYWGKRNNELILPQRGSLSVTLEGMGSMTTVEFQEDLKRDEFTLNDVEYTEGAEFQTVTKHLDLIRQSAGMSSYAKVVGENTVPTAAGLASSASGLAALSAAASKAAGMTYSDQELSALARRGSGSATRSIHGGFVKWLAGKQTDGSDSYAVQLFDEHYWPEFRMLVVVIDLSQKQVKSRAGMQQTVDTCDLYSSWLEATDRDLALMTQALTKKDFTRVGMHAEHNFFKLHAVMMSTQPAIVYWQPTTVEVIHAVHQWRDEGLEGYLTMDAGPQVKVLCMRKEVTILAEKLQSIAGVQKVIECRVGKGVQYLQHHLF